MRKKIILMLITLKYEDDWVLNIIWHRFIVPWYYLNVF